MQTDCKPLLYSHYDVTFQEVPGETSLVLEITGCPHHCPDCHSKFLWEYSGSPAAQDLPKLIQKYDGLITCVCFMGGDQNILELMQLAHLCQESHLKTCIYTGCTQKEFVDLIPEHNFSANMALFDYIKVGPYIKERGGLACKTTNQVFYKKVSASPHNTQYAPANYLFQKEYK